jgi:uncharacterized low-complexity protein
MIWKGLCMKLKSNRYLVLFAVIALVCLTAGIASAATVTNSITYQGKLTNAAGTPLTGIYSVTFTIYDASTGGTVLSTDTHSVTATNGLFTTSIAFTDSKVLDGRALWLGIKVGTDAEMTPRQEIRPVTYAMSLRPGAVINGTAATNPSLKIINTGDNSASLITGTTGTNSPALFANALGASPAVYALSPNNIGVYGSGKTGAYFTTNQGGAPSADHEAVNVTTEYDHNPGIGILTKGAYSNGVSIETRSINTDGVYVDAKGGTSAGVNAHMRGPDSVGLHTVAYSDDSTGVFAMAEGLNSRAMQAVTTRSSSPAIDVFTEGQYSDGVSIETRGFNTDGVYVDAKGESSAGVNAHMREADSVGLHTVAYSGNSYGVFVMAEGADSYGVYATTTNANSPAVYATASAANSRGVYAKSQQSEGVVGEAISAAGVKGYSTTKAGLWGVSDNDVGVYGDTVSGTYGVFTNDKMYAGAGIDAPNVDVAEFMPVTGDTGSGTVLVIGKGGVLSPSTQAYDTRVAGIVSTEPGVSLGIKPGGNDGEALIAVAGRVPCRVDASYGAIAEGDLLTSSPTPGHAMKAEPVTINGIELYRPGTVIGKAMESLTSGTGTIEVLVTLQ